MQITENFRHHLNDAECEVFNNIYCTVHGQIRSLYSTELAAMGGKKMVVIQNA